MHPKVVSGDKLRVKLVGDWSPENLGPYLKRLDAQIAVTRPLFQQVD